MLGRLKKRILEQDFHPGWLGIWTNPFYIARSTLATHIKKLAPELSGRLLDIGCGQKPYRRYCQNISTYIGMELFNPYNPRCCHADCWYDGIQFPFADNTFDSILCNQVLEHVFLPDNFLAEIQRVLKPGGTILLTVPFVWDEHEQPYDFARYSSFSLRYLFEKSGFDVITQEKTASDLRVLFQLFIGYLYKKVMTRSTILNLMITALLISPLTLLGTLLGRLFPSNDDLYLDNVLLAKKKATDSGQKPAFQQCHSELAQKPAQQSEWSQADAQQ